ncbi:MAG: hypothetical protein J6K52_05160 [Clostridia bacterium]|nr:hypothetical protein [Clostridia bacterium]
MFGYIKPNISELKVRDNELYKAAYCGLCRTMGKTTGRFSKMTLSYDFAFLALLRMAITGEKGVVKMRRCIAHPIKKVPMLEINESLKFGAKASVILTRLKLRDNINDSRGFARFKAKMASLVSIFLKKTDKELIPLEQKISGYIDELSELEGENTDSIDRVADTFGKLLGTLAEYGIDGEIKETVYNIGYHLGKWIYVIDACDDMKDDARTGSFNALINAYGKELAESQKEMIKCALYMELNAMSQCVEKLDFSKARDIEGIIKNIVYLGMPAEVRRVMGLPLPCQECVGNEQKE